VFNFLESSLAYLIFCALLAQRTFFLSFLCFQESLGIYLLLELSLIPIMFILLNSSTKECLSANTYLVSFSVVLGAFFFVDIVWRGSIINYQFLGALGIRAITFFAKLPIYGLHHWLPKAHVEAIAIGSAVLAGILLKLGSPSIFRYESFLLIRGLLCLQCLYRMWLTSDFKIWVAYSSISHITIVFSGYVLLLKTNFIYYFVPHTLLSSMMFFYLSKDYYLLRSRNFYYFSSMSYLYLVLVWCRIPVFINFLPELAIILGFFKLSVFSFLLYFLNFIAFFFVLCKFSWGSCLNGSYGLNYLSGSYVFYSWCLFIFWIFL